MVENDIPVRWTARGCNASSVGSRARAQTCGFVARFEGSNLSNLGSQPNRTPRRQRRGESAGARVTDPHGRTLKRLEARATPRILKELDEALVAHLDQARDPNLRPPKQVAFVKKGGAHLLRCSIATTLRSIMSSSAPPPALAQGLFTKTGLRMPTTLSSSSTSTSPQRTEDE